MVTDWDTIICHLQSAFLLRIDSASLCHLLIAPLNVCGEEGWVCVGGWRGVRGMGFPSTLRVPQLHNKNRIPILYPASYVGPRLRRRPNNANSIFYWLPDPVTQKHLYNICTVLDWHRRRWADVVQMLYKCFVLLGWLANNCLTPEVPQ